MAKHNVFCYSCDNEFTLKSDSKDEIKFCPFCGDELELADKDLEHEED